MTNLFEQPFEKLLIIKLMAAFRQKQLTKPSRNPGHAYQISKTLQLSPATRIQSFLESFLKEERLNEVSGNALPLTDWADAAFPPARWTPAVVGLPSLTATASSHQSCSSTPAPGESQTPGTPKKKMTKFSQICKNLNRRAARADISTGSIHL